MGDGGLREVNVKYDMPGSGDAIKRVTFSIRSGKELGFSAVKIIHGYGSAGKGGKIRVRTRSYLKSQQQKGLIRGFIEGENFSIFDEATRTAFKHCDELRRDSDLDRHNNGITIVLL